MPGVDQIIAHPLQAHQAGEEVSASGDTFVPDEHTEVCRLWASCLGRPWGACWWWALTGS